MRAIESLLLIGTALAVSQSTQADRVLPAVPPLAMVTPIVTDNTSELLQEILTRSGVRFAFEGAPPAGSPAVAEPFRPPEQTLALNGMRVGDALDRVVAADPRFEWSEADGRIAVRPITTRGAGGLLQQRIASFNVQRLSPKEALSELGRLVDPGRVSAGNVGVIASPSPAREAARPPISLSMSGVTVLEALDALADASGMSWLVKYTEGTPTAKGAILALHGGSDGFFSMPVRGRLAPGGARANRTVFVGPTLGVTLGMYADKARVLVGVELLAEDPDRPRPPGNRPALDLAGVSPEEGLTRILALDPRYGWFESSGIFNVRPRPDLAANSPLDATVGDFRVDGQTAEQVLERIVQLLGRASGRGQDYASADGSEDRTAQVAASQRPLTFDASGTTIRGALNILCRTEGTLSWVVTPTLQPRTAGAVGVTIQLHSWSGWGTSRTVQRSGW